MFKRRRLRYYHFIIVLILLALAVWLNIAYYFDNSAVCYANNTGVCSSIFTFIVVEVLAYLSILLLGLYIIYLIVIREGKQKEKQLEQAKYSKYIEKNVVVTAPKSPCNPTIKPNSINYSIERTEQTKAREPRFDKLVVYISDFPNVTTKTDAEKITYYIAGRPFIVLINRGYFYPMIFRHKLNDGKQLMMKYPMIKKNLSRDKEAWFIVENYNDLPKDTVYKIIKRAYDLVK